MSRLVRFPLLTREEVEQSPSRRDGVALKMEERRRRLTALHMKTVVHDLKG